MSLPSAVDSIVGLFKEGLALFGSDGAHAALLWIQDPDPYSRACTAVALAEGLGMTLQCVDLSTIASRYVEDTEKNLDRVFDEAREAGALLLFDETDALFGKRVEVRDAHDRHALLDESWLRSRLAGYDGTVAVISGRSGESALAALGLEWRKVGNEIRPARVRPMNQLVSIYLKPGCFLLLPCSLIGEYGPRIAEPPGVGISTDADDSALGQLILLVRTWCRNDLPPRDLRAGVPFPLSALAGLKSWGALTRSSPTMIDVAFSEDGIVIEKSRRDGLGYSVDSSASVHLPADTSASVLGETVRRVFARAC